MNSRLLDRDTVRLSAPFCRDCFTSPLFPFGMINRSSRDPALRRRARITCRGPYMDLLQEFSLVGRNWRAPLSWMPSPQDEWSVHVFFDCFRITAPVALRINQQFAQLPGRQTLPDHRVFGRRQVPSRRSWGHMYALKIVVLVTGRAIHWRNANTVASAPNIHEVPMQIISLTRVVSAGMADHATRMFQDRKHFLKRSEACFPADRMLH
jgi:hypothetical protein